MIIADTGFFFALANPCNRFAEHLGHGRILSSDRRDFQVYRWNQTQPFENLLLNYL
jgi:hypothetical protein